MKNALITGANKGIGLETAKQLLQKGFYVYIGSRNLENGLQAVKALKAGGLTNTEVVQIDVTDDNSIKNARTEIGKKTEVLDVLINNARELYWLNSSFTGEPVGSLYRTGLDTVSPEFIFDEIGLSPGMEVTGRTENPGEKKKKITTGISL